jgi:very-short-patch-repair endonuclease
VNEPIFDDAGQWLAEPDLHYAEAKLALEYNGVEHAEPARMRRDITRDIDLNRRGGWRIVTFGPREVFGRPDQVASYVRELLWELAPGLLRRAA